MWISATPLTQSRDGYTRQAHRVYIRLDQIESFQMDDMEPQATNVRTKSGDTWTLTVTVDELGELIEKKLKEEVIIR